MSRDVTSLFPSTPSAFTGCAVTHLLRPSQSRPAAVCLAGCRGWRRGTPRGGRPGCWWWPGCRPSAPCSSPGCTYPSSGHTSSSPPERPSRPDRSCSLLPSTRLRGKEDLEIAESCYNYPLCAITLLNNHERGLFDPCVDAPPHKGPKVSFTHGAAGPKMLCGPVSFVYSYKRSSIIDDLYLVLVSSGFLPKLLYKCRI